MQVMVYLRMSENDEMNPPSPEGMAEMGRIMSEGFESGTIVATGQLPSTATQVTVRDGKRSLSEGPVLTGKESIPGFTIIRVDNRQEAIDWAARLRSSMGDGSIHLAELSATGPEDMASG